ncbi:MAG: hypothetical protein ABEL04_03290 [Salinibacter sp.]|uniref:hypothetical protein n=1 Tax=Salinibacter sp. TaxID=2065818 RepID=UPI0035D4393C
MTDSHTLVGKHTLAVAIVLGSIGLLLGAGAPAVAQDRGRTAPSGRSTTPQHGVGSAGQKGGADRSVSEAPGTELPPAARPADPPSSLGRSPGGAVPSGGRAQTNSGPNMPGDPAQAPLGGAEWLVAAGAAYALNRLRKKGSTKADDEEE